MPTRKQSWLNRFATYYAATEENKRQFSKRIKQLTIMLEDESFLEYLSNPENKDDILTFLLNSSQFDDYIWVSEYDIPYIPDIDFGLINFMKNVFNAQIIQVKLLKPVKNGLNDTWLISWRGIGGLKLEKLLGK